MSNPAAAEANSDSIESIVSRSNNDNNASDAGASLVASQVSDEWQNPQRRRLFQERSSSGAGAGGRREQVAAVLPPTDGNTDGANRTIDITNVDPRAVDAMLANELQQLSFQDREAVNEEIHGVRVLAPEETPEMIDAALKSMQQVIDTKILTKLAYDEAIQRNSRYIHSRRFRLKFLRANLFDTTKAAWNFVKYLDLLYKYYGPEALMRPLYYSDLNQAETELLRAGHMQLLPTRDRSGRRVLNVFGAYRPEHTVFSKIKLALYIYGLASDDEETEKSGLVLIIAPTSEQQSVSDPEEHLEVAKFAQSMPVRFAAIHICLPDEGPVFHLVRATLVLLFASDQRIRVKFHTGLKMEYRYKLLTFGIPVKDLPDTEDGMVESSALMAFIRTRKAVDRALQSSRHFVLDSNIIECPTHRDVLFSRGGNAWSHVGNIRFRHLLESKRQAHSDAKNNDMKSRIIQDIVDTLEAAGFRFLVWEKPNGWWIRINDASAIRNKVAVAMRDHSKRFKERAKHQNTNSVSSLFSNQDGKKRKHPDDKTCGML